MVLLQKGQEFNNVGLIKNYNIWTGRHDFCSSSPYRNILKLGLLVTAAVSPSNVVMDAAYDIPKLSQYLDYVRQVKGVFWTLLHLDQLFFNLALMKKSKILTCSGQCDDVRLPRAVGQADGPRGPHVPAPARPEHLLQCGKQSVNFELPPKK